MNYDIDILDVMRTYPELDEEISNLISEWVKYAFGPSNKWEMKDQLDKLVRDHISKKRNETIDDIFKK